MKKLIIRLLRNRTCLAICLVVVIYLSLDTFGILIHIKEKNFFTEFRYPYNGDIQNYVAQLRLNLKPDTPPINYYNFSFANNLTTKCFLSEKSNTIRLVYLVKSSVRNQNNRIAIRRTWGYEKRFSDVEIRTVFLVGKSNNTEWNRYVTTEAEEHQDVVIINFFDNYYNNTIKTMMGFRWAVKFCANAQFYMFVDDDYYVSTRNVLHYIRNPTNYPENIKQFISNHDGNIKNKLKTSIVEDSDLSSDVRLYSGRVFQTSPHRHKISKWYVSLEEYPYHLWPPYVTAGAYILSKEAIVDFFYASFYTKHFRFDDIYVGLLSLKVHVEPLHCEEFLYHRKEDGANFEFTIASHGYESPDELISIWNVQRELGNA